MRAFAPLHADPAVLTPTSVFARTQFRERESRIHKQTMLRAVLKKPLPFHPTRAITSSPSPSSRMSLSTSAWRATAATAWSDPLPAESKELNRYICLLPDFDDAECLKRRLEVRQQHLDGAQEGKKVGRIGEYRVES